MLMKVYLTAAEQAHAVLTRLDQAAGDGDFGDNLRDGLRLVVRRIPDGVDLPTEFDIAATCFLDEVGGTSGPLIGLLLQDIAAHLAPHRDTVTQQAPHPATAVQQAPHQDTVAQQAPHRDTAAQQAARQDVDEALAAGLAAGIDTIQRVGEARLGDRTMLDCLIPTLDTITTATRPLDWVAIAGSALAAARATAHLKARMGRASYVGERALGTPDAGAMGMALLFWALAAYRHPDRRGELPDPAAL